MVQFVERNIRSSYIVQIEATFDREMWRSIYYNPFEELSNLRQTGSGEDYIAEFEYISSKVYQLSDEEYLGYFMCGFQPELCCWVCIFNPRNKSLMMKIARDVENEMIGTVDGRGYVVPRPLVGDSRTHSRNFNGNSCCKDPEQMFKSGEPMLGLRVSWDLPA